MFYLIHGVSAHVCDIFIIKYCLIIFYSALEPVLYSGSNVFESSSIDLIITPQSDYSFVQLNCRVNDYSTYPCSNLIQSFYYCQTKLTLNGVLGCNYSCYFITRKSSYNDAYSKIYSLTFSEYSFLNIN